MEAKKQKEDRLAATAKIWKFIKEEHSFENWLLFILALVLLVLSLYILIAGASDKNEFADTYFNISESGWAIFNKPWKVILISSLIVALSLGCIVYCLYPVFTPSFKELRFVTWTNKKTLFLNSITVLVFIAFFTLLFYVLDFGLIPLMQLIFGE